MTDRYRIPAKPDAQAATGGGSQQISTQAPAEAVGLVGALHREVGAALGSLGWGQRRAVGKDVGTAVASAMVDVAKRKLSAAVEVEVASYLTRSDAQRQVLAVHRWHNQGMLRGIMLMLRSRTEAKLLAIVEMYEREVDEETSRKFSYVAELEARGLISPHEAAQRRERQLRRSERRRLGFEDDVDAEVDAFKLWLREELAQLDRR